MRGRSIGGYEVLGLLGTGGMGSVYRARGPTGREVALKLIHTGALSPQRRARFQREAEALGKLRSPSILAVHAAGEHDGVPYLVTDLIDGRSLQALLDAGPLPPERVLEIVRALARALEHAHQAGVLHRDIKPGNVMLHADGGRPVLVDFGLSKLEGSAPGLTRSGAGAGTVGYAAPEQLQDASKVDARADIYGLGATAYALLTGGPPGANLPIAEALVVALEGCHPPPSSRCPGLDPAFDALVSKALAPPERRYPTMRALAEDLEALQAGAPLRHARVARWPTPGTALGVVALGGLALGGLAYAGRGTPAPVAEPLRPTPSVVVTQALAPEAELPGWVAALDPPPPLPLPRQLEASDKPGVFRHLPSGLELVWVPPGKVRTAVNEVARPVDGFFLGRTEVTWEEFRRLAPPSHEVRQPHGAGPRHPVTMISADEADAFCRALGLSLPSYAQWTLAASAGGTRRFPWGAGDPELVQDWPSNHVGVEDGYQSTCPVEAFPGDIAACGALGMGGNVREHVSGAPAGFEEQDDLSWCRGGSWKLSGYEAQSEDRGARKSRLHPSDAVGLRVAFDP